MTHRHGAWQTMHTLSSGLRIARLFEGMRKHFLRVRMPRKFGTRDCRQVPTRQRHKATCKFARKLQSPELRVPEMTASASPGQHLQAVVVLVQHWLMFGGHVVLWCYAG